MTSLQIAEPKGDAFFLLAYLFLEYSYSATQTDIISHFYILT